MILCGVGLCVVSERGRVREWEGGLMTMFIG